MTQANIFTIIIIKLHVRVYPLFLSFVPVFSSFFPFFWLYSPGIQSCGFGPFWTGFGSWVRHRKKPDPDPSRAKKMKIFQKAFQSFSMAFFALFIYPNCYRWFLVISEKKLKNIDLFMIEGLLEKSSGSGLFELDPDSEKTLPDPCIPKIPDPAPNHCPWY